MKKKKKLRIPLTGVLYFCDSLAHGVYKACSILGFSIPNDISVIGFDDNQLSAYSNPPLTTIYLPKEKMLEKCTEILKMMIDGRNTGPMRFFIDPYLVTRESVRYLKG